MDSGGASIPVRYWEGKENLEKACPWWAPGAIAYMQAYIPPSAHVLELGAGGSTLFFARRSKSVLSIESDDTWFQSVQAELQKHDIANVELLLVPTESSQRAFINSLADQSFDCILIDSHKSLDRGLLATCVTPKLKHGGYLIIDNYSWLHRNFLRYDIFTVAPKGCQQSRFQIGPFWRSIYFNDPHWMGKGTAIYQKTSFRESLRRYTRSLKSAIKRSPIRKLAEVLYRCFRKLRVTEHRIWVSPTLELTVIAAFKDYDWSRDQHNSCYKRFLDLLQETNVFFDIGAHVGLYTLAALKVTNNRVIVHAFEPNRAAYQTLLQHYRMNKCQNGILNPSLVGACAEVVTFFEGPLSHADRSSVLPPVNSISDYHRSMFKARKILTTSLDTYCNKLKIYPDLIKIDTEGAEIAVLQGALQLLTVVRPKIILSIHDNRFSDTEDHFLLLKKIIEEHRYYLIDAQENPVQELQAGEYLMLPL